MAYLNIDTYLPTAWQTPDHEAPLRAPSRAQRRGELVPRAWSELAAMKLTEGLATIEAIKAECEPLPMASIDRQGALLQAVSMSLNDDTEAAAEVVENAFAAHDGGAHPVAALLIRLGHWKARRLDAFYELSGSINHVPADRSDALLSILHLA